MLQPIIYFASDHAGFELKQVLVPFVRDILGYEVIDCGATTYNEEDDFTDFIAKAAREVSAHPKSAMGIILGGSGQGEAMLANRFHNVRAAVFYGGDLEIIKLSRTHNDANVLSLAARFMKIEEAKKAIMLWLHTAHVPAIKYDRRIEKTEIESDTQKVLTHTHTKVALEQEGNRASLTIVPSLPAQSFVEMQQLLEILKGTAQEIQIDIVDGVFVPYTSWPFTETDVPSELQRLQAFSSDFELEVDCMCMHPEAYLDVFVSAGIKRVIIHAGTTQHYEECIAHAHAHGYKIGLGILNTTPQEFLNTYLQQFDFVQVMGIASIGVQGQPFDERTLNTIRYIKQIYPHLEIAIDGAVNAHTINSLCEAGAHRFAPGSAIAKSENPVASYKQLAQQIGI